MSKTSLTFAGHLAERSVTSKLTLLFVLFCLLAGTLALLKTPREENPQIIVPAASVTLLWPGASIEQMENLVVKPLESIVQQIPAVDYYQSSIFHSSAVVMIQFEVGENKEQALVRLYDRVLGQLHLLPQGVETPVIRSIDADDIPVFAATLSADSFSVPQLRELAFRMLEVLRASPEVALTGVKGGSAQQLTIEVNPLALQSYQLTLAQLQQAIRASDLEIPLGSSVSQGKHIQLKTRGVLENPLAFLDVVVGVVQGQPVYLRDVAKIHYGADPQPETDSRFGYGAAHPVFAEQGANERSAVTLFVAKKPGTNAVQVADDMAQRLQQLQRDIVPDGVEVTITRNDGERANAAVNGLIEHLLIAVLSVFVVVAVFLGLREASIVGLTVPLVLALTMALAYLCGLTINRVSLYALILALGLLVDDAIVVVENIHRHYHQLDSGLDKRTRTVLAASEIGNPTNLATLAVMLVFGSLLVVSGMPGQYFFPVAFNVPVAVGVSLLVAYTVVPWAANRWLKYSEGAAPTSATQASTEQGGLVAFYHRWMTPLMHDRQKRWRVFWLVLGLLLLSLLQPAWQFVKPSGIGTEQPWFGVEITMMPKDNKNNFGILLKTPADFTVEQTDDYIRQISTLVAAHPEVLNYQVWVGQTGVPDFATLVRGQADLSGPQYADIRINLRDKSERRVSSIEIVQTLRGQIRALPLDWSRTVLQMNEDPPGPPTRSTILAELYGPDANTLQALAYQVASTFHHTRDLVDIYHTAEHTAGEQVFHIDATLAALHGLTVQEISAALQQLRTPQTVGYLRDSDAREPQPVRLQVPRRHELTEAALQSLSIPNRAGQWVPLNQIVSVSQAQAPLPLMRKNGERVVLVGAEVQDRSHLYAVLEMDNELDNSHFVDQSGRARQLSTRNMRMQEAHPMPADHYTLHWDGELRQMLDIYADLINALGLALLAIYLILVAYYQSFKMPLLAMTAIPLGIIGIFPGHWLLGEPFTATSMIGIIALAGIVVRNSLLIIDFVLDYREHGIPLEQAIVNAGAVRARPIALTTLTIMLGSLVMLADPVFSGLAISLIFGTLVSAVLTLIVLPFVLLRTLRHSWNAQ